MPTAGLANLLALTGKYFHEIPQVFMKMTVGPLH
jgi:hypothetical protein